MGRGTCSLGTGVGGQSWCSSYPQCADYLSSDEVASEGRRKWQRRGGTSPAAYADYLSPDANAGDERRGGMMFAAEQTEPVGGAASGVALPSVAGLRHGHPVPTPRVSTSAWASVSCFPARASNCAAASAAAAGENAAAEARSRAPRMRSERGSWREAHTLRSPTNCVDTPAEFDLLVRPCARAKAARRSPTLGRAGGAVARGGRERERAARRREESLEWGFPRFF